MVGRRHGIIAFALLLWTAAAAAAQDERRTGLVILAPAAAGLRWQVSDRMTIRPDFSFSTSSSSTDDADQPESDVSAVNVGVSVLVTVRRWHDLAAYAAPRVSYTRAVAETHGSVAGLNTESRTSTAGIAGSFGLHYRLGDRFGVFGETGLSLAIGTTTVDAAFRIADRRTTSLALRSALGVVFLF